MTFTLIGAVVLLLGLLIMLAGTRMQMLGFVLCCAVLNGSATIIITALGSVSIAPGLFATGLLFVRCVLPGSGHEPLMTTSLADNGWLLLLVGYSVIGAFTLPFLFSTTVEVVPLRPSNNPLGLTVFPLRFSPQNITTAGYMLTTLLAAVSAHSAVRRPGASSQVVRLASVIGLTQVAIGWGAAFARGTPLQAVFDWFRNGYYMQLDQSFEGVARLTGISPEPSLYASFSLIWFVFNTELWLRSVDRRWTGPASLALFLTLAASTSTTAYVGLSAYAAVILVRQVFFVGTIPAAKGLVIGACLLTLLAGVLALAIGSEEIARTLSRMFRLTTTEKLDSSSAAARMFWAKQGLNAFVQSWGLGIGVGSFRSSSILTAVIGSSGLIGIVSLVIYLFTVFRPFAGSTWRRTGAFDTDVSSAAAWTVIMVLIPASVSAPSPDPGLVWGLLAGMCLGLRRGPLLIVPNQRGQTASIPVLLWREAPRTAG
jgi:hypothetical protein